MKQYLQTLAKGNSLTADESFRLVDALMRADELGIPDSVIGAYLFSTAVRHVSTDELVGAARALRKYMLVVPVSTLLPHIELMDTCGTGGSGLNSFNTSTATAFVIAAAGQPVAKHGGRAVTSPSGSADVLRELGINLELSEDRIAKCIAETSFGFLFAPHHHPAMKRVAQLRRELALRTIFNFLGPICNPAGATYQLLGVSEREMVPRVASALHQLGAKRAMVVRGEDGLDEISLSAPTAVVELDGKTSREYTIKPEDFGLKTVPHSEVEGAKPEISAQLIRGIFKGERSARRDLVVLNAGAGLYVARKATSLGEGVTLATSLLDSGAALAVLERVVQFTTAN